MLWLFFGQGFLNGRFWVANSRKVTQVTFGLLLHELSDLLIGSALELDGRIRYKIEMKYFHFYVEF